MTKVPKVNANEKNRLAIHRLMRAIALSKNQFALILVRCNYRQLREQLLINFRSLTQEIKLKEISLPPVTTNLHNQIFTEIFLDDLPIDEDDLPSAVMVFGLESITNIEDLLTGINQARDIYAETFHFPVVLWLQDEVASLLSKLAPDFKSWAATTIKFELDKADLIALIHQETESLFTKVLAAGAGRFLSNASLDLDPKSQQRHEIESARDDLLRLYGIQLEPALEASLEFVVGRDEYSNDQIDAAISHYHQSITLWQQQLNTEILAENQELNSPYLLHYAILLFHLGLCYRRIAELYQSANSSYYEDALLWFQQCLDVLMTANREDLVAKFISPTCEVLKRLKAWKDLEKSTKISLHLHEIYGNPAQVAEDYGFLATIAAAESNWILAYELANTALSITEIVPEVSGHQESWYLLLLAKSQRNLGEWSEAINNLEWARLVCEPQYEPLLYLEIIEELQTLYFSEVHDYAEAFNLKQEKIQIEHQYGFRAFIGASQLQPQRYRINPILASQPISFLPEEIAQEISTSGRMQDVNRLIERITRADYKLTVIYETIRCR